MSDRGSRGEAGAVGWRSIQRFALCICMDANLFSNEPSAQWSPANPFRKAGAAGPSAALGWLPVEELPRLACAVKKDFELPVSRAQFTLGGV